VLHFLGCVSWSQVSGSPQPLEPASAPDTPNWLACSPAFPAFDHLCLLQVTHRGIWALAEACPLLEHINIGEGAAGCSTECRR